MIKTDYPLILSRNIKELLDLIQDAQLRNSELIETIPSKEIGNNNLVIGLRGLREFSNFQFLILEPRMMDKEPYYRIDRTPQNSSSNDRITFECGFKDTINSFNNWFQLIIDFTKFDFHQKDEFRRIYENQFYADFEIVEDDSYTTPFDSNRQLLLYHLIDQTQILIVKSEIEDSESLIEEANDLKCSLTKITKHESVKRLSKLMANIRLKSIKVYNDVLDVGKKEIIKAVLHAGYNEIGQFVTTLIGN